MFPCTCLQFFNFFSRLRGVKVLPKVSDSFNSFNMSLMMQSASEKEGYEEKQSVREEEEEEAAAR